MPKDHACPTCGCEYGQYGLIGGRIPGTSVHVDGLLIKIQKLSAELLKCKRKIQQLQKKKEVVPIQNRP